MNIKDLDSLPITNHYIWKEIPEIPNNYRINHPNGFEEVFYYYPESEYLLEYLHFRNRNLRFEGIKIETDKYNHSG